MTGVTQSSIGQPEEQGLELIGEKLQKSNLKIGVLSITS